MTNEQDRPLWAVMDTASWNRMKQGPYAPQDPIAAMIRAIADEIAAHPMADRCTEWGDVADWLRAEAERAEKGE